MDRRVAITSCRTIRSRSVPQLSDEELAHAKEHFEKLYLSKAQRMSLAFRRCTLVWIDGAQIDVLFIPKDSKKKDGAANSA
ncbi:hypothetical protein SAMN05443247_06070 [Bradyrhizobium erythrophlei]|jgi:hypothetical protein|nr:hypothetical protein SAMN05443247_06070 [Bradyrhizobium erythrophlei]